MPIEILVERRFRSALSHIPHHNYLNGLYHETGLYRLAPPASRMWRLSANEVPLAVRKKVDVDPVVQTTCERIAQARDAVNEVRAELDTTVGRQVHHLPNTDYNLCIPDGPITRSAYGKGWNYIFNPYEAAVGLLDIYETFIAQVMRQRVVPFTKIARICEEAKRLNGPTSLVGSEMWYRLK